MTNVEAVSFKAFDVILLRFLNKVILANPSKKKKLINEILFLV